MILNSKKLKDYQILITGANGFLGRKLVQFLLTYNAYIVGIDITELPLIFKEKEIYHYIKGDIYSSTILKNSINKLANGDRVFSAVFHLAGMTDVEKCEKDPEAAFYSNVMLTIRTLEACRKKNISRIIFPSTSLVYGNFSNMPVREDAPTAPNTIYGSGKLAAEAVLEDYSKAFDFSCDIVRLSNVYGSGASKNTVVSTVVHQAILGGPIILKDLSPLRDFIYIDDVIEGLVSLLLSGSEQGCRVFNLSSGLSTSIYELASTMCRVAGIPEKITEIEKEKTSSISKLVLENSNLYGRTGWRPSRTLEEGLFLMLQHEKKSNNE